MKHKVIPRFDLTNFIKGNQLNKSYLIDTAISVDKMIIDLNNGSFKERNIFICNNGELIIVDSVIIYDDNGKLEKLYPHEYEIDINFYREQKIKTLL